MAVLRVNKTSNYTVMSNYHFKEKEMSLKAKGLLSLMLSLPDNWDYSIMGLVAICKENETAINSTLKELKKFGYLVITKLAPNQTESGRFEYVYNIYEQPHLQDTQKQAIEKQGVENLGVEFQGVENQGQYNTNNKITNKLSNKELSINNVTPITPKADLVSFEEKAFNDFWSIYPKKVNKQGTLRAFKKIKNLKAELPLILDAVERFKNSKGWQKDNGQYIPHPTTFINQERWKDEQEDTRDDFLKNISMEGWI